mgnify:CR=1 FL=1
MADVVGFLSVLLKGARQTFVGSGLTVYQPVDAGMIAGDGILFDVKGDDLGWYYDGGTTDTVYLITTDGDSVTLTRKGDYFMWEIGANDLRTPATAPSADASFTAQIVVDRVLAVVSTLRGNGTAVLLVEQLIEKVLAIADRVYAMAQGSVVLEAKASEPNLPHRLERAYFGVEKATPDPA